LSPFAAALPSTGAIKAAAGAALALVNHTAKAADAPGWHVHAASGDTANSDTSGLFITSTLLSNDSLTTEHAIDGVCDIAMHNQFLPALLFDHNIESRRSLALQDTLLSMTTTRLLVTKGHGLDTPYQIGERRVDKQVTKRVPMGSSHKLYTAFGDGTGGSRFQFGTNFIYDDDLRHMIFDSLNHHRVLFSRASYLHTTRTTDTGMRNIPITRDFIGGINDHHTFIGFVREDARYFTQQSSFTHTWATENQNGLTLFDNITDQGNTAEYRSTNTAGQADNFSLAIAEGANTMERTLYTSTVIVAKFTNTLDHVFEVGVGHWLST
jgi:hypothetical protein